MKLTNAVLILGALLLGAASASTYTSNGLDAGFNIKPIEATQFSVKAADSNSFVVTLVGMSGKSSGMTYAQSKSGTWTTDWFSASVLHNNSGQPDPTAKDYIRHQGFYTLDIKPELGYEISQILMVEQSGNAGDFSALSLTNAKGAYSGSDYLLTPIDPASEIIASYPSGKSMLRYNLEITVSELPTAGDAIRLEVATPPTRTDFFVGEAFNIDGLEILGYDENGNSKAIDTSLIEFEPSVGHIFTEEDITPDGGVEVYGIYQEGDAILEFGNGTDVVGWNYTVSEVPETEKYNLIDGSTDLLVGSKVILGLDGTLSEKFAARFESERLYVGTETVTPANDGAIYIDPLQDVQPIVFEVRVGLDEGTFALYSESEGGYLTGKSGGTELNFSQTLKGLGCLSISESGNNGYRIVFPNNTNRFLGMSSSYIRGYASSGTNDEVHLYSLPTTPEESATELARYIMESDTAGQCVTKFPVARRAYLELMNDEGRAAFELITDAYERYLAWAAALGENPFANEPAAAYLPYGQSENTSTWLALGALGLATVVGCLGFFGLKKRKKA